MTSFQSRLPSVLLAGVFFALTSNAHAVQLIAQGSLSGQALDKSGLDYMLENGTSASLAGGLGSGLA